MARTVERIDTEVFIAGTGPAGCTFARFLVPAGKRVIMADAGAQLSARPGAHLKNAFGYQRDIDKFTPIVQGLLHQISVPPQPGYTTTLDPISFQPPRHKHHAAARSGRNPRQDPYQNLPAAAVSYAVGGMLTHWTNNTPRHHPTMERIPFISAAEWDGLYAQAESLLNTRTDVFAKSIRHRIVQEALQTHYAGRLHPNHLVQALPVAGQRLQDNDELVHYTGSDTILAPLLDENGGYRYRPEQFRILPEHRVKKLVTANGRVTYALVEDLIGWKEIHVYADIFVVAGGAVLTPQLLWNSAISHESEGPLGRYLTEHPMTFTQIVLSQKLMDTIQSLMGGSSDDDPIPIPMNDPPPMVWIPVQEGRPWHCQIHRDSFQYGLVPPDIDNRLIVDLRWFGMVGTNRENRVSFETDLKDKFGMPQPTFEYTLSEDDRRRAHDMMQDMVEAAHALGGFFPGSEPRFMPPGTSLHLQGTTRIGPQNDGTCVTDLDSKVWGIDNLYLGGNGLIPTTNASNPTLTSVALAMRAAQHILGKKAPPPQPGA